MNYSHNHKLAIATVGAWWLTNVVAPAKVFHYGRAAQRDERNGFPYTAAMEWRKAAELSVPKARAAEYCWRQWERIMHLPRLLAGPVGAAEPAAFPESSFSLVARDRLGPRSDFVCKCSVRREGPPITA
jgi:hypothetical protein